MDSTDVFDTEGYLARIGYLGPREATVKVLEAVHTAHLGAIPFENIDVLLGRPIALDLASLQAKLVGHRRGGYCFEQNTVFAAALRSLGFAVSTLEARVRPPGATRTLPRTHMTLRIDVGGRPLLADVGFGGNGPLAPVPLDGEVVQQGQDAFRVVVEERVRVLQIRRDGAWQDLYAFVLDEALPVDFEVANHYTSTYPASPFTQTLTAQLTLPDERRVLRGRRLTVRRGGAESGRDVADGELLELLRASFGIELPPGTRLSSSG